jgi:hypothetical protein
VWGRPAGFWSKSQGLRRPAGEIWGLYVDVEGAHAAASGVFCSLLRDACPEAGHAPGKPATSGVLPRTDPLSRAPPAGVILGVCGQSRVLLVSARPTRRRIASASGCSPRDVDSLVDVGDPGRLWSHCRSGQDQPSRPSRRTNTGPSETRRGAEGEEVVALCHG